jgi:Iron-containing redox enzyme
MTNESLEWTGEAPKLGGPGFNRFQIQLTKYNAWRLRPQLSGPAWREELARESKVVLAEAKFVEAVRKEVAPLLNEVPQEVDHFIRWFEELRESGPGQGDPLFPWLATEATHEQMLWFLTQEVAGEAGFDDLLALTQVQMPELAKLEMARNYWDEMGRGTSKGMHGPMLHRLAKFLEIDPHPEAIVPEALALGNMMISLARNRRYAYQSVGALGVIEMTAPTRASYVDAGLKRLGVPAKKRHYFTLHAVLDIKHSECWNREVLRSLVDEDSRRAHAIGEGAILRLWHGARCFERYRSQFGLISEESEAA